MALFGIEGHKAKTVYMPEEGPEAVDRIMPDVVLFDIGLPRIDGYEVERRIKNAHPSMFVMVGGLKIRPTRARPGSTDVDFDMLIELINPR